MFSLIGRLIFFNRTSGGPLFCRENKFPFPLLEGLSLGEEVTEVCHVGEASFDVTPKRVMADLRAAGPKVLAKPVCGSLAPCCRIRLLISSIIRACVFCVRRAVGKGFRANLCREATAVMGI